MGLWNYLRTAVTGVDLDATQATLNASDTRLAALNRAALASGQYDQATYDQAQAHWYTGQIPDAAGDVGQAFQDGARQGFDNVTGVIKAGINFPAKWTLKFIWDALPWWVWLGLLAGVLWYFGLLQKLVRKATA